MFAALGSMKTFLVVWAGQFVSLVGSGLTGFAVSVFLRVGGGDATLGLPAFLPYPEWEVDFPFRTLAMVAGLVTSFAVSRLSASADPPRPLARVGGD